MVAGKRQSPPESFYDCDPDVTSPPPPSVIMIAELNFASGEAVPVLKRLKMVLSMCP